MKLVYMNRILWSIIIDVGEILSRIYSLRLLWRYRLARPRTSASQAEYTGSNPVSATLIFSSLVNSLDK